MQCISLLTFVWRPAHMYHVQLVGIHSLSWVQVTELKPASWVAGAFPYWALTVALK